jgi:hypothetical protein
VTASSSASRSSGGGARSAELRGRMGLLLSAGQQAEWRRWLGGTVHEAGRRGWRWAYAAAWCHRTRSLAQAERDRCVLVWCALSAAGACR